MSLLLLTGTLTSTLRQCQLKYLWHKSQEDYATKAQAAKIEVEDVISPNGQPINLKASFAGTLNKEENKSDRHLDAGRPTPGSATDYVQARTTRTSDDLSYGHTFNAIPISTEQK